MAKSTNKNTTGRSVHQSITPLEDAVASFIADIEDRLEQQLLLGSGEGEDSED